MLAKQNSQFYNQSKMKQPHGTGPSSPNANFISSGIRPPNLVISGVNGGYGPSGYQTERQAVVKSSHADHKKPLHMKVPKIDLKQSFDVINYGQTTVNSICQSSIKNQNIMNRTRLSPIQVDEHASTIRAFANISATSNPPPPQKALLKGNFNKGFMPVGMRRQLYNNPDQRLARLKPESGSPNFFCFISPKAAVQKSLAVTSNTSPNSFREPHIASVQTC